MGKAAAPKPKPKVVRKVSRPVLDSDESEGDADPSESESDKDAGDDSFNL
eukprot:NODE_3150_length_699_cov_342.829231_g2233_i0.p6 GENE.NODE_3150_length_699_cov_342.829231_g2233_i0~~NODE_3150_length_699_cov_342.829231_g2233_i0.p6  ORF type:complete len:59 (+),score=20.57 NODE_3150_length_699_cov_342.829231_g2233_i0:30-179(+)